jgi:hypothetical protein
MDAYEGVQVGNPSLFLDFNGNFDTSRRLSKILKNQAS